MSRRLTHAVLLLVTAALPVWGTPQGLGDAAARERAKREKEAKSAKPGGTTYTDADLAARRPPESAENKDNTSAPAAAPTGNAERTPADEGAGRQGAEGPASRARENRVREAEERVHSAETRVAELRDKLNPMSGSYIYGATGSNSANEEIQVRAELTEAERTLAEAQQQLSAAKAAAAESSSPADTDAPSQEQ